MDIDLVLESIFEEYKDKAIKEGKARQEIETHLSIVREQMEEIVKESTDNFIGHPNNVETEEAIRNVINQQLNQFLDTDIILDSINQDGDRLDINMTYRPKSSASGIQVTGSIKTITSSPILDIISNSL